ncbi:MAG: hypothetical protein KIT22_01505 [Verrucomicrobiae bacterium]|nr:hypothetical protein [Verrucomicrobiae bacterium]
MGALASGAEGEVLNCLSQFALHCARAGARQVLGLDQSAAAVAAAGEHARANGLAARARFEAANVF